MARKSSTERASKSLSAGKLYRSETLPPAVVVLWKGLAIGVVLSLALGLGGCVRHFYVPYLETRYSETGSGSKTETRTESESRPEWHRPAPEALFAPVAAPEAPHPTLRPLPAGELDYGWHDGFLASKPKPCTGRVEPSAKVMISRSPGAKRWVVILPIWGSSIYPPRQIARRLLRGPAARHTNVLWILGPDELFDWQAMADAATESDYLDVVERGAECLAASVRDVREWLDWIAARDDHDPRRLGLVGFSIGAIAAASVVAVDSRPDATVLVMGGGRLEHIFAGCRGDARMARDAALETFDWSLDEFLSRVGTPLAPVDPVGWLVSTEGQRHGPAVDPSSIFFVSATRDTCVPQISRQSLWHALGRPERLQVPYGHKMSFLSMTFLGFHHTSHRIVDFLDRRLRPQRTPLEQQTTSTPRTP